MNGGKFIISLDLELMWGVRDNRTIDTYGSSILGVSNALDQMLDVFEQYKIKATFAVVGFLFHKNQRSLFENIPSLTPSYFDSNLSPYPGLKSVLGEEGTGDSYYFGYSLIKRIKNKEIHEIATHTYCHYYCLELGQTVCQFEEDMKYAIAVANFNDIDLKSIVFPRNQFSDEYLKVCKNLGITAYRGNEKSRIYTSSNGESQSLIRRALRFVDSFINISGHHCYKDEQMKESILINIPSSRFLRPYSAKLVLLEYFKFLRIKNAMTYAAKNNLMYHIWWHPHNFGTNCFENIRFLRRILKHYEFLNVKYKFQSMTMEELSLILKPS